MLVHISGCIVFLLPRFYEANLTRACASRKRAGPNRRLCGMVQPQVPLRYRNNMVPCCLETSNDIHNGMTWRAAATPHLCPNVPTTISSAQPLWIFTRRNREWPFRRSSGRPMRIYALLPFKGMDWRRWELLLRICLALQFKNILPNPAVTTSLLWPIGGRLQANRLVLKRAWAISP